MQLTGTCCGCGKQTPTELYADDWTTRVEYYEWCLRCAVEADGVPWDEYIFSQT